MQVARQLPLAHPGPQIRRPVADRPAPGHSQPAAAARHRHRGLWVILVLCWSLAVSGGLYYVHRQAELARLGFAMTAMRAEWDRLQAENEELAARVNQFKSISRIEAIATRPVSEGGLGMFNPTHLQVTVIDPTALPAPATDGAATVAAGPDPAGPAAAPGEPGLWQRFTKWATALGEIRPATRAAVR